MRRADAKAAAAVTAALVAGLVLSAAPAHVWAQDDEPPPWETGDVTEPPPWESGAPPEPAPRASEGPDVHLQPPGVDSERPYRGRTKTMKTTPLDELGITKRREDGTEWTVIPFDARGPVVYGGVGYETGSRLGHLVLTAAGGWTVWGHWRSLVAEGRVPRVEGTATQVLLSFDVAPKVAQGTVPSWLTIGVRAQQVFALGRHLLSAQLSLGGRKDLGTELGGIDFTFGVGYAYAIEPPFTIPVQIEAVRHYSGTFEGRRWGFRISMAWPLWFRF